MPKPFVVQLKYGPRIALIDKNNTLRANQKDTTKNLMPKHLLPLMLIKSVIQKPLQQLN